MVATDRGATGLRHARAVQHPRRVARTQGAGIVAEPVVDHVAARAAVAQRHGQRVIGLPRQDPCRALDLGVAAGNGDDVAGLDTEALGQGRPERDDIVPDDLGQRLRQFLQPAVGRVRTVADRRVGAEQDGQAIGANVARRTRRGGRRGTGRHGLCGGRGVGQEPVGQRRPPLRLEGGRILGPSPEVLHEASPVPGIGVEQKRENFRDGSSLVERHHGRLDQARRAVDRPGVAPAFQRMRERQMPVGPQRRLVDIGAGVDLGLHLGEGLGEAERARRLVDGVAIEDQQHLDLARRHRGDEIGECPGLRQHRLAEAHRRADGAELGVEPMHGSVNLGTLRGAGEDEALAFRLAQGGSPLARPSDRLCPSGRFYHRMVRAAARRSRRRGAPRDRACRRARRRGESPPLHW